MRTVLGSLFLTGLFVVAGLGVLHAIRPFGVRSLRSAALSLLAAAGLAYLVGMAAVLLLAIGLLVAGIALSLPAFTLLALGVAGGGAAVGALRRPAVAAPRPVATRADRIVLIVVAVLFGGFALAALSQYTSAPMFEWDSWTIWTRKAVALFTMRTLVPEFWSGPNYVFMHQDYPLLIPMLEMLHFRAIGRIDTQSVHVQFWFLLVAFPWAMAYLASRTGRAVVWAPIVLGAVAAPAILTVEIGGMADVPVAMFLACGALALGLWVDRRDRADLAVAAILLAGAASTKNEGLLGAVILLLAAALVVGIAPARRDLRALGIAAAAFLVAILPWQAWAAASGVPKDFRPADALNPLYLADHAGRLWPAIQGLYVQMVDQSRWSYFVPLALVTAVVALWARRASRAAAFYLLAGVGCFAGLVWAYWGSTPPIGWYISLSAFRIVGVIAAVAMAALVHLAPRLAAAVEDDADDTVPAEPAGLETGDEPAAVGRERLPAHVLASWRT